MTKQEQAFCNFCGKKAKDVSQLFKGKDAYICNECVDFCKYVENETNQTATDNKTSPKKELIKPMQIKETLDQYVIGQEKAKKILSVAVYNHYKRIFYKNSIPDDIEIQKSNILMLGPTGSGKTLLAQTLAKILDVPFSIADATTLTEAGYVGEDVENILLRLLHAADFNIERAETGIIFIDEIDKIGRKTSNVSITRDVSGEGVQQALLKILEGTVANIPSHGGRKHPGEEYIKMNTKNILFICGGAFPGIEKIIEKRKNNTDGKNVIGFNAKIHAIQQENKKKNYKGVIPEDFIKFGLIPEFIGRLPVTTVLEPLDKPALIRILQEPKNALIKQYQNLLKIDGIQLTFTNEALDTIAEEAIKRGTGARGLKSIIETVMQDIMYKAPSNNDTKEFIVTKDFVIKQLTQEDAA